MKIKCVFIFMSYFHLTAWFLIQPPCNDRFQKIILIIKWNQVKWGVSDSSPQGPESTSWDWRMYRFCTLGIVCVSSLQSGQLTTMTNQCEETTDSLRLPEEKITGNNWDGMTCGTLWGVESNPLCPELWNRSINIYCISLLFNQVKVSLRLKSLFQKKCIGTGNQAWCLLWTKQ